MAIRLAALLFTAVVSLGAQWRSDFSGTWILDAARSGPSKVVWNQDRSSKFVILHNDREVTIDTGDGRLFAMRERVTDGPLVCKTDGSSATDVDRSLGDLANFAHKIRTELKRDGSKLITLTTHFFETDGASSGGVTRVLTFSLLSGGREMAVERTGYRDNTPSAAIPLIIMHHGRMEDDLIYPKDRAIYTKTGR